MATFGTKPSHISSSHTGDQLLHTIVRMFALALAAIAVLYAMQAYGRFDALQLPTKTSNHFLAPAYYTPSDNSPPLTRYEIPSGP